MVVHSWLGQQRFGDAVPTEPLDRCVVAARLSLMINEAMLAAGAFQTFAQAQERLCPGFRTVLPDPDQAEVYEKLFGLYSKMYFSMGIRNAAPMAVGDVLPELRNISTQAKRPEPQRTMDSSLSSH